MFSPLRHIPSIVWKNRPIQLTFFVTRKCNARCPFCFYLQSTVTLETANDELSLQEIQTISRSCDKLLWLAFSGGEVFLRKDIIEISAIFYKQNKPVIMLFPTNGLLPELIFNAIQEIVTTCPHSTIVVKLSMDGIGGKHDALRGTPGGFNKFLETYRLLAPLLSRFPNFELGVNTVFCSENQDQMNELIDFAQSLKHIRTHTISMIRGDLIHGHFQQVDPAMYLSAINKLKNNLCSTQARVYGFRGAGIKTAQDILQRRLIHATLLRKTRLIDCYAGKLNVVLTETGDVYPCELQPSRLGNIRQYNCDLTKLLASNSVQQAIKAVHKNRCYCTHECNFITNILFNPRMYPALAKEYLRLRRNYSVGEDVSTLPC